MEPKVHTPQPIVYQPQAAAPVVLPAQQMTVAYRPGPDGQMIAEYVPVQALATAQQHHLVQAPPAAPVVHGIDPRAQIIAAGGIGAGAAGAGIGWGLGQALAGVATLGGSTAVVVALALLLWAKVSAPTSSGAAKPGTTVNIRKAVIKRSHFQG